MAGKKKNVGKTIDLSKLSLDDLKALKKDVEKAITGFQSRKRAEAMKEVQEVAKKHGISVDELMGKGGKRKVKAPAKYQNPSDSSQTWSGRGRQPVWFKAAVKSGKSAESMEI